MKFSLVVFSLLIVFSGSGCASAKKAVGTSDIPTVYDGRWDGIYAQLTESGFTNYCIESSGAEYIHGFSCNRVFRSSEYYNYFSLGNGQPVFGTGGMTCSSRLDHGLKIKSTWKYRYLKGKCESPSFVWNKDPVISKYLTYVFVFPLLNLVREYEFYFDWNKASKALEEAVTGDNYGRVDKAVSDLKSEYSLRLEEKRKLDAEAAMRAAEKAQRKAELEKREAEEMLAEQRRLEAEERLLPQKFNELATRSKTVGDKVCRKDNLYGFVEGISGSRIQVRVLGQVFEQEISTLESTIVDGPTFRVIEEPKSAADYYFFRSGDKSFRAREINEIGWFESKDFAECSFDINW